jgi:hypothetical protein
MRFVLPDFVSIRKVEVTEEEGFAVIFNRIACRLGFWSIVAASVLIDSGLSINLSRLFHFYFERQGMVARGKTDFYS